MVRGCAGDLLGDLDGVPTLWGSNWEKDDALRCITKLQCCFCYIHAHNMGTCVACIRPKVHVPCS